MKKGVGLIFTLILVVFMVGNVVAANMKRTEISNEEFNKIVHNDPSYIKTKEYAGFLGYGPKNLFSATSEESKNEAVKLEFPDGQFLYEPLSSGKNLSISIAWFEKNNITYSFIIKQEIVNEEMIVTFFNEEGGIKINTNKGEVIDQWSTHHSCDYWTCVWNGIEGASLWDLLLCGKDCVLCAVTELSDVVDCFLCVECLIEQGWDTLGVCAINNCYNYPCKTDCSEKNFYNYSQYCFSGNVWKKKTYNAFKCPDYVDYGETGTCEVDPLDSKITENLLYKNCQSGCNNGECIGASSNPEENCSAKILELGKKLQEDETKLSALEKWKESITDILSNLLDVISNMGLSITGHTARIADLENKTYECKSDDYLKYLSSSDRKAMVCGYAKDNNLTSIIDLGYNCTITYRTSSSGRVTSTCRCSKI